MSEPVLTTPTETPPGLVTAEVAPLAEGSLDLVEVAAFYPPYPIRWHHVAPRNPHFWTAYAPRTGSSPTGWALLQYGTKRPAAPQGDVRGWAGGGYAMHFTAPRGLTRRFVVSMRYTTDLLTRQRGAAWLLQTRAFLIVQAPGFFREHYAPVEQKGTTTELRTELFLTAGTTYTIAAGAAIQLGVRNFGPNHWRTYAEMAGRLHHVRVEQFLLEPIPRDELEAVGPEGEVDPGEGREAPESEVLDETEVTPEEMAAQTRRELGLD